MKSTPTRGVKQSLKPDAYKQLEPSLQMAEDENANVDTVSEFISMAP